MTPSEPQRLHPLTPFFDLILFGRQLAVPLVIAIFAGGASNRSEAFLAVPVLVGTLFGALKWWRFTYTFDGQRLIIDEGVLTRKRRVVPLDRVQQVELQSKLRHRLLGVTVLRVDTAGGGDDAEIDLSVVSVAEAERLRVILTPAQAASTSELEAGSGLQLRSEGRDGVLVRLSPWRLAIAGMTGSELALMLTIVGWSLQFVDDISIDLVDVLDGRLASPPSVAEFVAVALTLLVAWFGLAAIAGVVKHFGFEMRRTGSDLRVRRGLFERREGSMPLHRLQVVFVAESIVRRALRFASMTLQSAGQATGVRRIDVPILRRTEVEPLLRMLLPLSDGWTTEPLRAHPPAARRRAIVRRVVLAAVAVAAPAVVLGGAAGVALVALALVVGAIAGELAYAGLGHAEVEGVVTARAGGVARSTVVVPGAKVQSTRLRSTPLQRRAGLATLWIDVAGKGRTPAIRDAAADQLGLLQAALVLAPEIRGDELELRSSL